MVLEFMLFGPVSARAGDKDVDLGPFRQRCVLAVLLLEANRHVTLDQLAERVWGSQAPQHARGTLRSYLSRLRGVIAVDNDVVLERRSEGYRLVVDDARVDLHLFRSLTTQARRTDDAEERVRILQRALGITQDDPLSGLDSLWFASVRAAVQVELLTAEVEHAELQLDQGRGSGLTPRLSELASLNPLDERVAAQLMRALCWEGRKSDALRQFEWTRQQLAGELGVSPGSQLSQLHLSLLGEDMDASPTQRFAPAAEPGRTPRQLPAATLGFVGRTAEWAELDQLLEEQQCPSFENGPRPLAVAVINGTGGVGKTALAVQWAQRVKGRFPDGQLYLNLRGFGPTESCVAPADALMTLLCALGVAPESVPVGLDERSALLRSELDDRRMLILLDNARDSDQVRPLLPGGSSFLIVTSRRSLRALTVREGGRSIALRGLSAPEAVRLLLGPGHRTRDEGERAAAQKIVEHCAGLPLALRLCADRAARLAHLSLAGLSDELADQHDRLRALSEDESPETDLNAVFAWSYNAMGPEAAELFLLLSVYPGKPLGTHAAAALAGVDRAKGAALLGRLADASLVDQMASDHYEVHDLLHQYARDRARRSRVDTHSALQRLLTWYAHTAERARWQLSQTSHRLNLSRFPPPSAEPKDFESSEEAIDWFDHEREVIVELITRQADECGAHELVVMLCQLSWTYFYQRGHWHHMTETHESAVRSAVIVGDPLLEGKLRNGLSTGYGRLGHWHAAARSCEKALATFERIQDPVEQATALLNLGSIYNKIERHTEAQAALERSQELFKYEGDELSSAMALNNLAETLTRMQLYDAALDAATRAVAVFDQDSTEPMRRVAGWGTVAAVHAARGDHESALTGCQKALAAAESTRTTNAAVSLRVRMGEQLHALGRTAEALSVWDEARQLCRQLGDMIAERNIERLANEAGLPTEGLTPEVG